MEDELPELHKRFDEILSNLKEIQEDLAIEARKITIAKCGWHQKINSTKSGMIDLLLNRDESRVQASGGVGSRRKKTLTLEWLSGFYTSDQKV